MKKNKYIYIIITVLICLLTLSILIIKEYNQEKRVTVTLDDLKIRIEKNANIEITKEGTQIIQTKHKITDITCLYSISTIKIDDINTVKENGFEKENGIYRIILDEPDKSPNYVLLLDMNYDTYISLFISNIPEDVDLTELYNTFNLR